MGTGFSVDLEALRQTGQRAGVIADGLGASTSVSGGATTQVITTHQGWLASSALRACAHAWATRLSAARENLEQISATLNRTASAYEQTEHDITAKINHVISELGG